MHCWKIYPYVGYGHQLQPGERFTTDITEHQADLHPKRRAMPANPYTYRFSSLEEEAFVDSLLVDILLCCARKGI